MIQVLGNVSQCKDDASHLQVFDVSAILWFDFLVVAVAVWLQMYQELSVPPRGYCLYFPESLEFQECHRGCFFFP